MILGGEVERGLKFLNSAISTANNFEYHEHVLFPILTLLYFYYSYPGTNTSFITPGNILSEMHRLLVINQLRLGEDFIMEFDDHLENISLNSKHPDKKWFPILLDVFHTNQSLNALENWQKWQQINANVTFLPFKPHKKFCIDKKK